MPSRLRAAFGPDFRWGTTSSACSVEGAADEDGRTPSTWDVFASRPGNVADGATPAVAADHYHRYLEDVALLRALGVTSHRFSIAWSRIQPTPDGTVNEAGLDFYDRLVDTLLAAGVEPWATLWRWDTPQWLEDQGGWESREPAYRMAEYAALVGERLADRITRWTTVDEPLIPNLFGHGTGLHAPGKQLRFDTAPVAYRLLLAHGLSVQALRAAGAASVGIVNNHVPVWHVDEPGAVESAEYFDVLHNQFFADPVILGRWPEGVPTRFLDFRDDDLDLISAPLDFYGVNYYGPRLVGPPVLDGKEPLDGGGEGLPLMAGLPFSVRRVQGRELTDAGWPIVPEGLTELLVSMRDHYDRALPPIVVTECGAVYNEGPDAAGRVGDGRRADYLGAHLEAVLDAQVAGVEVEGFFVRSLLDGFEWSAGYQPRFGLVHVDFDTQVRTPKDSFHAYRAVIDANRHAR